MRGELKGLAVGQRVDAGRQVALTRHLRPADGTD
jgi:hypothetical protein